MQARHVFPTGMVLLLKQKYILDPTTSEFSPLHYFIIQLFNFMIQLFDFIGSMVRLETNFNRENIKFIRWCHISQNL